MNIKLRPYQQEIINDTSNSIIASIDREMGKDLIISYKILKEKPKKVLYIDNDNSISSFKSFSYNLKNFLKEEVEKIEIKFDSVKIVFLNKVETQIYRYKNELTRGLRADLIVFNNISPFNLLVYSDIISYSNSISKSKILCLTSEKIYSYRKEKSRKQFLEEQLNKLQEEYSNIPIKSNTVMTREKILNMILGLSKEIRELGDISE